MKTQTGTMSKKSRSEYLEVSRESYKRRNRAGKNAMLDEVSELLEWDRKHTIKVLNGKASFGVKAEEAIKSNLQR